MRFTPDTLPTAPHCRAKQPRRFQKPAQYRESLGRYLYSSRWDRVSGSAREFDPQVHTSTCARIPRMSETDMRESCACLKQTCANLRMSETDMRRICAHVCTWGGLFVPGWQYAREIPRMSVSNQHSRNLRMSETDMRGICACLKQTCAELRAHTCGPGTWG